MNYKGYRVYDDDAFFKRYTEKRAKGNSPNETIEKPIIDELLQDVSGKDILDLGCGEGIYGIELLKSGANSYDGVEGSNNMIEKAKKRLAQYNSKLEQTSIEEYAFPTEKYDIVLSRLVFHYIENLEPVFEGIYQSLKRGGVLVFSVEHPLITSCYESYHAHSKRGNWIVDDYFKSGERVNKWIGKDVVKYHKTIEEYFALFKKSNLTLLELRESKPQKENFTNQEDFERRSRIPLFMIFKLIK